MAISLGIYPIFRQTHLIVCLRLVRQQNREETVKRAKTLTFASKFGIDSGALLRLPVSMLATEPSKLVSIDISRHEDITHNVPSGKLT